MHLFFLTVRIFPFWAVPVALVCLQLAVHFWRRRRSLQYPFWLLTLALLVAVGAWVYYRGDVNSDRWVRSMLLN